jgi:uncharacterized protein
VLQPRPTVIFTVLLFVIACGSASAQQQPGKSDAPPPKELLLGPPQDRIQLTQDQLKSCMKQAIEITAFNSRMDTLNTNLEQERQRIKAQGEDVEAMRRTLNRSSQKAVDDFNAKINDYNTAQTAFNTLIGKHGVTERDGAAMGRAYIGCAGVNYSKAHEAAVLSELRLSDNPMHLIGKARLKVASTSCRLDVNAIFDRAEAAYVAKDYHVAQREFLILDQCGDARAHHRLGDMHYAGLGMPQNLNVARDWYLKAATQNHVESQFNLAVMSSKGQGIAQDYAEARKWYLKAAEQGHASAQNSLGAMFQGGLGGGRDIAESAKWYRRAADQGVAKAQLHLSWLYLRGTGIPLDAVEAHRWNLKAAMQGDPDAQYHLGELHGNGTGVTADYADAVGWWFKAAKQGNVLAQYRLAEAYLNLGLFDKRDRTDLLKAYMWAMLTEKTACQQLKALGEKNAALLTVDQRATAIACMGAPSYQGVAEMMMSASEIAVAKKFANDWKANSATDIAPSPQALRALPQRVPPLPPPARPGAPGAFKLQDGSGRSAHGWFAVPTADIPKRQ